ncbi:short chain dehydrogenase [Oleiphilus sp. HI0009]|uniref:SDR family oxidoreductase n=1 Tax=unclassified Oleiphilus TaxID=2631174 RepID=UPI0007C37731|nr:MULTISPECIES: NAD(P)-dependent oxidoreductase [unclassified Oleiphilus]KZX76017.1 short chain dehydrogenase [Oleiphilus sp. HI0009]KZX86029.1 short chain dehydrogenase [Oleiphilus sp. HI0009]KZY64966.1 short chain dehydrogenase [Oleiphilus sp. HI0066]KZY71197.1 short chain dehydrogenase [Oleiphilus sp. HI0067]
MSTLKDKVIFISGASRGIGREMALRFAQDGANIVIAAKSADPHPKLPGTIHTVAEEVIQAGGQALPIQVDVRDDEAVVAAVESAAAHFGGIDVVINNAGAIKLTNSENLPMKRFDLMHHINTRAVLSLSKAALPFLKKSEHGHILSLSPPLNLDPKWFAHYGPYTITKYGMSMLTLSLAQEYRRYGIAVNSLWPQTVIATAAVEFEGGGKTILEKGRIPAIMADAAYEVVRSENLSITGELLIDESVLRNSGVTDFEQYRYSDENTKPLMKDLFVE